MAFRNALLLMLIAAPFVFVNAQTTVDWTLNKSYSSYSTQSFKPGGTIVFNYDQSLHNVLVVSKSDYDSCTTGNALQTFTGGKSTISLKQGPMYFICGTPGHCQQGMKLQVNVGDSGSSTPTTPTTTPAPADSRSTPTPSAPSPKDSSGAAALSSVVHLTFAVSLVLAALFAFMC